MVPGGIQDGSGILTHKNAIARRAGGWFQGGSGMDPRSLRTKIPLLAVRADGSWIRAEERRTLPAKPWEESIEAFQTRLKGVVGNINKECNVEGLCWQLPERVDKLYSNKGGRLSK